MKEYDITAGGIFDNNVLSFDIKKRFHCLIVDE